MKKKLLLLDVALLALLALLGGRLREKWLDARKRESVALGQRVTPAPPPPYAVLSAPPPLTPADYAPVAQQMLFSADRNPAVVVVQAPPPEPPPPPSFYGALNIDGPMAIMSVTPTSPHKQVRFGEKIGEYTLVKVTRDEVILDWQGKQVVKKIHELMARQPVEQAAAAAPAPVAAGAVKDLSPQKQSGPGSDLGAGARSCVPGDTSPAGATMDGLRKVVKASPFGEVCRWEPAN